MEEFAYWLPGPKTADDETVPVGMDHIHIVCIRLVQPNFGGVALKKGSSRVKACWDIFQSSFQQNPPSPVILLRFLNSFPTKPDT